MHFSKGSVGRVREQLLSIDSPRSVIEAACVPYADPFKSSIARPINDCILRPRGVYD